MIEIKNVNKVYKGKLETVALKDVNITIDQHEFVVIVGPSGCGKTTLLNMIAGYDHATSGEVLMYGKEITQPSFKRGVISQDCALYPWLDVTGNVDYGMKARNIDSKTIKSKTTQILKDVGLSEFSTHKTFELSGGMKQRVSLAQTLINDPEVILMDEPLGALDTLTRATMQKLIHSLWKEKALTILMITHDIEEALQLATKIYVMSSSPGTIIEAYHPTFYKQENQDLVLLDTSFIAMKQHILNQIVK